MRGGAKNAMLEAIKGDEGPNFLGGAEAEFGDEFAKPINVKCLLAIRNVVRFCVGFFIRESKNDFACVLDMRG